MLIYVPMSSTKQSQLENCIWLPRMLSREAENNSKTNGSLFPDMKQ